MFGSIKSLIALPALRLAPWNKPGGDERKEGERLFEKSDYAGAELHLAQAILESEQRQESADKRILLRLELAEAQRKQYQEGANPQKLADAEETVRSAFDLASRTGERELAIQTLDASSVIATDRGDLDEAYRLVEEAGAMEAKLKHRDPMQSARRLHCLGLLRQRQGRLREAVELLAQSAAIHEKTLGESHLATAHRLSDLGAVHYALGNQAEAQRCLRRAIRVHEQQSGLDSPEAAADLQMLTESLEASGDIDGAAAQFERVLALKLRVVGQDLDTVADAQWELARRYLGWRRYSRARELLMEAVGTFKRKGGARLASGYEVLAQLEEDTGHYHEALRELARAGKVWESVKSEHVAELIQNLEHRVFLFDLLRQHKEAAFLREQAAALTQAARWAEAG
jgi:tetratricopeptide (TPR) repeat protein